MYKIIASDLDGTLLTPDHKIAPFTKATLNQLHQLGKDFIFATGRHHIDVAGMREQLGIPAYMITSNGARVHNCQGEVIFKQDVAEDVASDIIALAKQDPALKIHLYRNDDWLLNVEDEELKKFHDTFSYKLFDVDNPPLQGLAKIFFTRDDRDHDKLVEWENTFNDLFGERVNVAFSTPWCLEIMDAKVSKGHALEAVAKEKGHTLADCIAFGDGMNDIEMLSMAGKGLIMGTAHEKVKRALPEHDIIGACDDEAVAHYLAELLIK
ncbi:MULTISPECIES: Cof-type HAD-IIB family hydrolase [Photobacterium]|uniref:Hydrolase n=1 Tax=Photobacterium ganghwense TaxID=320778 RepID=A0A0J1H1S1_9GAMM|nr:MULTISPECIES: Cof-type HAD-IIB family hydrolase [Photobacterium]KLV05764.1 hydrolase [Photobacterium ganghwense]MBV1839214.1 Cof-type HAD-IIB family hydrolase [Photobacterium ganghwense]PSU06303.1 Cof-type HAD-IIB family hydrolase [Photobacterium ganghwense]QSV14173.1 Cof-type HAD-IIB family hydrolase [Photobacterium ganghwense]